MRLWPFQTRRSEPAEVPVTQESLLAFVRAGGAVSLGEWVSMDPATQAALERAGTAVRGEFALAMAACLVGGADAVAAAVDGGQAAEDSRLESLLNRALRGRVAHG